MAIHYHLMLNEQQSEEEWGGQRGRGVVWLYCPSAGACGEEGNHGNKIWRIMATSTPNSLYSLVLKGKHDTLTTWALNPQC